MGHKNNNKGTRWAQQYNKGVVLIRVMGYTSSGDEVSPIEQTSMLV